MVIQKNHLPKSFQNNVFRNKVLPEEPNGHPEEPSSEKFPEQHLPETFRNKVLPDDHLILLKEPYSGNFPEEVVLELSEEVVLPESSRKTVLLKEPNVPGLRFPHFF